MRPNLFNPQYWFIRLSTRASHGGSRARALGQLLGRLADHEEALPSLLLGVVGGLDVEEGQGPLAVKELRDGVDELLWKHDVPVGEVAEQSLGKAEKGLAIHGFRRALGEVGECGVKVLGVDGLLELGEEIPLLDDDFFGLVDEPSDAVVISEHVAELLALSRSLDCIAHVLVGDLGEGERLGIEPERRVVWAFLDQLCADTDESEEDHPVPALGLLL